MAFLIAQYSDHGSMLADKSIPPRVSRSFPHDHHWRSRNFVLCESLQTRMRLALLIVVFYIFLRGEGRLGENVEALCARVVDRAVGFDGEDVRFAVLYAVIPCKLGSCPGVQCKSGIPSADLARGSGISREIVGCRPRWLF